MPVVYIDVVWLVNFAMDAALLWTTCWILKRSARVWRILIGAMIGSLYALVLFAPSLSLLTTWPGKAIVSLIMVAVSIPWRSALDLARIAAVYYLVACVFAGAAIAAHFALPGVSVARGVVTAHGGLAFWTGLGTLALLVAMPIAAGLLRAVLGHVRRQHLRQASLVRVAAGLGERTVSFIGLVDTGNQLRDPITRRPVCLVEGRVLAELFPESVRPRLQAGAEWQSVVAELGDDPLVRRLSFIPFRGAGGVEQFTIAIKPDVMMIEREGRLLPATQPCLLALHSGSLAHDNTFQAILHTEVLTGVDGHDGKQQAAETTPAAAVAPEAVVDADSHPLGGRS